MADEIAFDLNGCARCDAIGHPNLTFHKFANPVGKYTYWALCPNTNEPILLKLEARLFENIEGE